MKSVLLSGAALSLAIILSVFSGCASKAEFEKCVRRNQIQMERIQSLEAAQESGHIEADKIKQQNQLLGEKHRLAQQKLSALEASLKAKNALINQLSEQLGQTALPVELSNALADWASQSGLEMVSYDEKAGIVRFKSDLLFDSGRATVKPAAQKQIVALSAILNSATAEKFDILIVGHTDDQPIKYSAGEHPTNWHLSAHRAIAVEDIFAEAGTNEARLAIIGMGEFRPIEPNKPDKKGNAKNRRVEIYIVPAGQLRISDS